ncbi:MAG: hypothetical protein ABL901_18050 [Hyphomicrobiaceae bacterium]
MPPINNSGEAASGKKKAAEFPDFDNPLAWRRATLEGAQGALKLLGSLTDEEVRRYMAVARDQIAIEQRLAGLKIAIAIAGVGIVAWFLWQGMATGFSKWVVAGLGLGVGMGYWPWRVLKCKQLWQKHFDAARAELIRRNVSV